jgi:hypothetical protein
MHTDVCTAPDIKHDCNSEQNIPPMKVHSVEPLDPSYGHNDRVGWLWRQLYQTVPSDAITALIPCIILVMGTLSSSV